MRWIDELREGLAIAWDAIRANRLRSVLTTLGIVIGIVTVTLMGTAIQAVDRSFRRAIASLGADVIYVVKFSPFSGDKWWTLRNRRDLTLAQAYALERQLTLAQMVVPEANASPTVKRRDRSARNVNVVGTTANNFIARNFVIARGRNFTAGEVDTSRPVCVLGADVAARFFPFESPLGEKLHLDGKPFEIVGVMAPFDKFLGLGSDNHIFIPITQFTAHFVPNPNITILVKAADVNEVEECREELRSVLRKIRGLAPAQPEDFATIQQDIFLSMFARVGGTFALAGLLITSLSLFVGGIGIMNIMYVSVAERTREIGVRKAIGAKRRTILIQFLIEAASLCLLGGLVGLLIAFAITLSLPSHFQAQLSPIIVTFALVMAAATGVSAGFLPAWRAARLNPVDALRSE